MPNVTQEGDRITLGQLDTRILLVLLLGSMNGYQVGRQCEADTNYDLKISRGTLYRTLKSLERCYLVTSKSDVKRGREFKIYRITAMGRQVLNWHITDLQTIVSLARERSQTKKPPHK